MPLRHLLSYGGLDSANASVFEPKTLEELQQLLQRLQAEKRRVTVRGGGYSFDAWNQVYAGKICCTHFVRMD